MEKQTNTPECIGIILDGNRRWAKQRSKPTLEGHKAGLENLETIVRHAQSNDIRHVVAYAFSTENWNRSEGEVSYLMNLIVQGTKEHLLRLKDEGVRVRIIGRREQLPKEAQEAVRELEEESREQTSCTLWVAISYGGRAEIVEAARAAAESGEEITEEMFRTHMWSAEMPDPDIIIRTGGEQRLSNFLLWQAAYSELFFTETLWPDFTQEEFDRILEAYGNRERRRGK